MHCLLSLSCRIVTYDHTNLNKPKAKSRPSALNVNDLLLPPGIEGLNNHEDHSMISHIDSFNY